ncbi:immunoglobulin superfamily member 1-like [Petaurus breviceps papuanus]|uniref:immunoglobulin superfamily member 1-like n=1 Tax=Petaurus breviceps papuanus TaxID=3040969 RepID=UPI0036D7E609
MGPTITFLISIAESPGGTDVTLRCQGHLGSDRFQLWRDGELREERNASWQQAEFVLRSVDASRDERSYSFLSGQGPLWSELSELLALVVTGAFPKPSISASASSKISPGTTVTIWCQISPKAPFQEYSFALLEAKSLEPLQWQSPAGDRATFSLLSVTAEFTGSYTCIYCKKTAPHMGSIPSQVLELTVTGQLLRPTLWAEPGLLVTPGTNITLWCSRPKSSLEEVTFTLRKAGTQKPLQQQMQGPHRDKAWCLHSQLCPGAWQDSGALGDMRHCHCDLESGEERCDNRLTGSLPKPSLSALPGLLVEPRMHVTLQCQPPPQTSLSGLTFTLLKVGTPQALQSQSPAGASADFPLLSVRAQDAGNYSCVYHRKMFPYHVSEPSEVLELWVTDALPKPSLSAWPQVTSGANVTLLCQGPSRSSSFVLYKDRDEKILASMQNTQDGAKFFLTHMIPQDSGNYSCSYQLSTNGNLWTQHSDPLQLIVTDPLPRPTLWAVPSPVVPGGADVTLRCQGHLGSDRFQLWKDGEFREERNASWQQAEFMLRSVDAWRDGRSYHCRSGQGPLWSELSEPLALVVTGTSVTIWCQISQKMAYSQGYSFALLEAKSLEPLQLQSPAGFRAIFSLLSVRPEDTGNYSCVYYRKTAPHKGSHPSKMLELIVPGRFPKPTLGAQSSLVVAPGANITLWCSRPKLSSLGEVIFTLWKAGIQKPLQQQTSADLWTSFLLPSVRPEDTGSYSCAYMDHTVSARESEPSEALELVVPGSLPKPSLSALPGLVVEPGMHVTLQCRQPPQTFLSGLTFTLLKVGTPQALQSQSPAGTSAAFPLLSVRAQDAGNYSCVYYERMAPYQVSEPSEVLELWVTDALPKPSFSAQPGPEVASGANVTFLCWGPSWGSRFVLYKEGGEKDLPRIDTSQGGAQFFLTHVNPQDSGSYSCSYQRVTNGSLWTQHSDPLQLTVRDVTLMCQGHLGSDRFQLWSDGELREERNASGQQAEFVLRSVDAWRDGRNYSCRSGQGTLWSKLSEPLALVVTAQLQLWLFHDAVPDWDYSFALLEAKSLECLQRQSPAGLMAVFPFLSVRPGPEVASGANVTLLCWGPSWGSRFVLYKEGDEKTLLSMEASQGGTKFFLTHVTPQDSGSYSCSYKISTNGSLWTQHSDPLQLTVRGERKKPPEPTGGAKDHSLHCP